MYMTKNIPTIQSVFRLLGALIGYTALSFGCLFMGNYSKGIFIDIPLGLLVIVLTYGLFNLGISKAYRSAINKELRWLSLIFLVLGLFMMYEVGFGYKSNDALFLTRALICSALFFVTAVIILLISRNPGVWGCILVMCLTILIFVEMYKALHNIYINTAFMVPFFIILDVWKDANKGAGRK